ncbi:hypothetical protein CAEBREN_07568 [Caenorhabditis brenneri]|uniref:SPK domain-containing protein n=1 Tax=Caenorhabditis brenneri TaxID=135651 RepID=G0NIZ6_CAEBE|nr:hypothetical protein CAEBREN_07568 [Caenorhabditis brenneri]
MWEFLLKEIVDPVTGLIERDRIKAKGLAVWEKFRVEMGDYRTATSLRKRYSMPSFPTPQMMNFDVDSQIKLHYALGIPIDGAHLNELLDHADVDLDEYSCIVRYKDRRPGGLELRPFVRHRRRKRDEQDDGDNNTLKLLKTVDWEIPMEGADSGSREVSIDGEEQEHQGPMQNLWSALMEAAPSSSEILNGIVKDEVFDEPEKSGKNSAVSSPTKPTSGPGSGKQIDTKVYLDNLNTFVSKIGSTELEGVQLKIAKAMGNSEGRKLPMEKVKMMIEATLAMMGF